VVEAADAVLGEVGADDRGAGAGAGDALQHRRRQVVGRRQDQHPLRAGEGVVDGGVIPVGEALVAAGQAVRLAGLLQGAVQAEEGAHRPAEGEQGDQRPPALAARRQHRPAAPAARQQPLAEQLRHHLARGHVADRELERQVALGGERTQIVVALGQAVA
jgi:hypothetical protein